MEEMQKAFNKTIIKLQNTSRIAEEQVRKSRALNDKPCCASRCYTAL